MCGILGCANFKYEPASLTCISHRGPDGDGMKEFKAGVHQLNLAHRRLSIVDTSENGSQPMFSADGNSCIVFNGEIYNHEDLKKSLDHVSFKGHSDTETLVNYFNENSVADNLSRLNGIFGFALYKIKEGKLYLTRDRFGVKPVYYYFENNQLIFSSELRPFRHYIKMVYDRENIIEGLKMRYVAAPDTIYEKIKKVEPGQVIIFDLNKEKITAEKKYYVTEIKSGSRRQDLAGLVKEYGDLFERAVERQLMSDVELGVLLSGGIDSALVAAVAKNKSNTAIKTFTVGYEEGLHEADEIEMAKITADTLGLENIHTRVSFRDFIGDLKTILRIVEEPIATNSIIPMYSLSRLASEHVKVVLSGQGADEPLYGYRKYKGLKILQPTRSNALLRTAVALGGAARAGKEDVRRLLDAVKQKDMFDSYREYNSISSPAELVDLFEQENAGSVAGVLEKKKMAFRQLWEKRTPGNQPIVTFPYLDLRTSLADDLLMYSDKLMMNFGVECRVPILDNDLVAFIESIHHTYKFNFSRGKIIHKEFAAAYLPASIIHRKKIGFSTPASKWYDTYRKEMEDILFSSKELQRLFNMNSIKTLLEDHYKNHTREKQILLLLSLSLLND